jgi:hypothetical protein
MRYSERDRGRRGEESEGRFVREELGGRGWGTDD